MGSLWCGVRVLCCSHAYNWPIICVFVEISAPQAKFWSIKPSITIITLMRFNIFGSFSRLIIPSMWSAENDAKEKRRRRVKMMMMFGDQKATKHRSSVLILIGNCLVFICRANIMLNVNNANIHNTNVYHSHSSISDADSIIMKGHKRR